jgi:hypothetical protein
MISKQRLLLHSPLHITRKLLFIYPCIRITVAFFASDEIALSAAMGLEVRVVLG